MKINLINNWYRGIYEGKMVVNLTNLQKNPNTKIPKIKIINNKHDS